MNLILTVLGVAFVWYVTLKLCRVAAMADRMDEEIFRRYEAERRE